MRRWVNNLAKWCRLPALGGFFWMIDYRIPFVAGSALGVVSLIAAQWMNVPDRATQAGD